MRIEKSEAKRRAEYLQMFLSRTLNSELRDTLLRFFMTFSNFEAMFGEQRELLQGSPFNNIDYSFAATAFNFFVKRYITDGNMNSKYTVALWRGNYMNDAVSQEVEPILKNENASGKDKVRAVYRIAYRFRDNLLHGNDGKETSKLPEYERCFCIINDFMFQLMKQLIEEGE